MSAKGAAVLTGCLVVLLVAPMVQVRAESATAPSWPVGLWLSRNGWGPTVRGPLTVVLSGASSRAEVGGRRATFAMVGDSVAFPLAGDLGAFRGVLDRGRKEVRGFWIQPAQVPLGQPFATPMRLARIGTDRYRGTIVPLEERFTVFLEVWSDSTGLRGVFRNPEFNLQGGASRFRVSVEGDTLHLTARPDTTRPELRIDAHADRSRTRLRMKWEGLDSVLTFEPCRPGDAARFWPRMPGAPRPVYRPPPATGDGWTTARAASVGFDEPALARFVAAIADTDVTAPRAPLIHACLIERHGRLVFEEYFFGHDRDDPHDLRSASKTFASVLVGAAMHQGLGIAPESTLCALMANEAPFANPDPRKLRITVGDAMTHTTGLACDDNDDASLGREDTMQGQTAVGDWCKYILDLPMVHDPGTHYAYASGGMNLAGGAVSAVTRRWLPEYFDATIARPLDFGRYHYNLMPNQEGYMGGGLRLRPRDLLKLGRAYLDGGTWRGRRIVDSSWVSRSTAQLAVGPYGPDGYAWHLNQVKTADRTYREYEANGNGGQLLIVLPELDMSIVFTAGNYARGGIWTKFRDELVPQRIIGALREQ